MYLSTHRYSTAQSSLERAMRLQHPESFALMSWLLQHGREGIPVQLDIAHDFAKQGWRLGCEHSQGALANCFLNGWGVARNMQTALKLAKESASKGSKYGQYVFGIVNVAHPGLLHKNQELATTLSLNNLKLASDQGLPEAHVCYANALLSFETNIPGHTGIENVDVVVMRLYEQAAFCGVAAAHDIIGEMYEKGLGVPADMEAAANHYKRALQIAASSDRALRANKMLVDPSSPAASANSRLQPPTNTVSKQGRHSAVDSEAPSPTLVSGDAAQAQAQAQRAQDRPALADASETDPASLIPSVIKKLGKLLGSVDCPNCNQNADIGTKCTATGAYHL